MVSPETILNISIPARLLRFLNAYPVYYLVCHEDPDADSVTSCLALASFLRREGKEPYLFSPSPFSRPEIKDYEGSFSTERWSRKNRERIGCIILDCSTLDRIGPFSDALDGFETAVIDHHAGGRPFGSVRFIVPEAPSVTFLIQHIIETLSPGVTRQEAEYIFLGLCTDTGFFRHLESGSAGVFESTARLIAAGASPKTVYQAMYGNRTPSARMLLGRTLSRIEHHFKGKVLYTYETLLDKEEMGADSRDSDTLYSLLQGIKGVDVVIFLREEEPGLISAGLRSSATDVSTVASACGGGGHPRAAGFTRQGTLEDVKTFLLEQFCPLFSASAS